VQWPEVGAALRRFPWVVGSGKLAAVVVYKTMAVVSLLAMLGCASDSAARKPHEPKVAAPVIAAVEPPPPPPEPPPPDAVMTPVPPSTAPKKVIRVKGLTGTLNTDDVYQTMETRQPDLDACILESRRRLRLVSGVIKFSFKIDAAGAIEDVHPTESSIGHFALESCILKVLSETVFPPPDGDASARFDWDLTVVPATARAPDPLEPDALDKVLEKKADELREECETKRRERFVVTAYISRRGKVLSAGAVPQPASASAQLECVLERIKSWKMPKGKREAKVTFMLK
jgi:hypothetical protein